MRALIAAVAAMLAVQGTQVSGDQAASAPPTAVPTPGTLVTAEKLVTMMRIEQTLDAMMLQMAPLFGESVIAALRTNPATQAQVERIIAQGEGGQPHLSAILQQEFVASAHRRWPQYKEEVAKEYANAFTEDELQAIISFYNSGAGAKALRLAPMMQEHLSARGRDIGRQAGKEAGQRAFERARKEMMPQSKAPDT